MGVNKEISIWQLKKWDLTSDKEKYASFTQSKLL